jgi:hypothetical protein
MKNFILILITIHSVSIFAEVKIDPKKWKKSYDRGNVKIYSQEVKGYDVIAFKTRAKVKADILNLLTVLRDAKGAVKWSDNLKHLEYIEQPNDLSATVYEIRDFPWPFEDRDVIVKYNCYINHERKSIYVDFHSVKHPKFPKKKNRTRGKLYFGAMEFWPRKNGTDIELIILAHPKGSIPSWVVNIFQEKVPYEYIKALEKQTTKNKRTPLPGIKALVDEFFKTYPLN